MALAIIQTNLSLIKSIQDAILLESQGKHRNPKVVLTGSMAILFYIYAGYGEFAANLYLQNVGKNPEDMDYLSNVSTTKFSASNLVGWHRVEKYQIRSGKYFLDDKSFDLTLETSVPIKIISIEGIEIFVHEFRDMYDTYIENERDDEYHQNKINEMTKAINGIYESKNIKNITEDINRQTIQQFSGISKSLFFEDD